VPGAERIEIVPPGRRPDEGSEGDPHSFLRRHAVAILRTIAVIALIVLILLLWQGVAEGGDPEAGLPADAAAKTPTQGEPASAPEPGDARDESDPRDAEFDPRKLEEYLAAQSARRAAAAREGAAAPAPHAGGAPSAMSGRAGIIGPEGAGSATASAGGVIPAGAAPLPEVPPGPIAAPPAPPLGAGALLAPPPMRGAPDPTPTRDSAALEGPPPPAPLLAIPAVDLDWQDGFSFALSLQAEFAEVEPAEIPALRAELSRWLLEFGRLSPSGDNPLDRLGALLELLASGPRLVVAGGDTLATLLPSRVLAERRAGPLGWCVISLALADRIRGLELEPVLCRGVPGLRYENGAHRYVITPALPDRVLTDREFAALASAGGAPTAEVVPLTRSQLCGRALAVGGIDRIAAGAWPRGFELLDRALALDPRQPAALLALAQVRLERGEEELALEAFAAATALDPSDRTVRRARAELLLGLGRPDEAREDLAALAADGSSAEDMLRYARLLQEGGEHRLARDALAPLDGRKLPRELAAAREALERDLAAAPWLEILAGAGDDLARLAATRRLAEFPGPRTEEALIAVLEDPNGRLSGSALATLREITGIRDLPRDPSRWRRALAERGR